MAEGAQQGRGNFPCCARATLRSIRVLMLAYATEYLFVLVMVVLHVCALLELMAACASPLQKPACPANMHLT